MALLMKQSFVYKVATESAATEIIEQAKEESSGVVSYKSDFKTKKTKGEIVDSWWIVTITHDYSSGE